MEIIGKVKIKDEITTADIANIVNNIVDAIIYKDGDEIVYQPYFFDDAVKMSIFVCLLEGVQLDEDDKILEILRTDEIIKKLIDDFVEGNDDIADIMGYAYDLIDFRKEQYLRKNDELDELLKKAVAKENALNDMLLELAQTQNKVLTQQAEMNAKQEEVYSQLTTDELASIQKKIANGEFNMNDMVNTVVERYMENDKDRDQKYKEIIDQKNKKILDLTVKDHLKKGGTK